MTIQIEKKLGLCKVCGCFYKCKPGTASQTKYCSRQCQLKDYVHRDRTHSMLGKRFNAFTVVFYYGKDNRGNLLWGCQCDEAVTFYISTTDLQTGRKKKCGCVK